MDISYVNIMASRPNGDAIVISSGNNQPVLDGDTYGRYANVDTTVCDGIVWWCNYCNVIKHNVIASIQFKMPGFAIKGFYVSNILAMLTPWSTTFCTKSNIYVTTNMFRSASKI